MNRAHLLRASWRDWMIQTARPAGPAWWQYAWTFLFSMVVAAGFTIVGFVLFASGEGAWRNVAGWGRWYLNYLVVSLAIGFSIHGLFELGKRIAGAARIEGFGRWQRLAYYSAIPSIGLALGLSIGLPLAQVNTRPWSPPSDTNSLVGGLLLVLLTLAIFQVYFWGRARRIVAERRAAQAQLQLLQAQMEPHFLFNTLANVVGLMEADAPRAKAMLESFTDYLRASLGSLREPAHSLGDELELIDAYLRVAKVRMEDRLQYRVDVAPALRRLSVPTLSLQPLVENAVVHGLEPSVNGGSMCVTAERAGQLLILCVSDTGVGLQPTRRSGGSGTALRNLRERLQQLNEPGGMLLVEPGATGGVRATLKLPLPAEHGSITADRRAPPPRLPKDHHP